MQIDPEPADAVAAKFFWPMCPILIAFGLLDIFLLPVSDGIGPIPGILFAATFAALVGSTAVLLGFGEAPMLIRLFAIAAPIGLAGVGLLFHEQTGLVANFYWLAFLAAIPCGVARLFGWKIRLRSAAEATIGSTADWRRGQFTLGQTFATTTYVAVLTALLKFTSMPPLSQGIAIIVFGGFLWAIARATLAVEQPGWRLPVIITASFFLQSFVQFLLDQNLMEAVVVGQMTSLTLSVIGFVLLLVRPSGFVYLRNPRTN